MLKLVAPRPMEATHRFRNFGEDVYRELRDRWTISITEIDASTDHFFVRDIKPRWLRRTKAELQKLIGKHKFETQVGIHDV